MSLNYARFKIKQKRKIETMMYQDSMNFRGFGFNWLKSFTNLTKLVKRNNIFSYDMIIIFVLAFGLGLLIGRLIEEIEENKRLKNDLKFRV